MIYLLTGEIDSGKSTAVVKYARKLAEEGKEISGWITPAHMDGDKKIGHDFVLIDRSQFAEPIPFTRLHEFENSFKWRRFYFNKEAFKLADGLSNGCDLFIMDEIGPLEIEDGKGFTQILGRILDKPKHLLIVMRNGLCDATPVFIGARKHEIFLLKEKPDFTESITLAIDQGS